MSFGQQEDGCSISSDIVQCILACASQTAGSLTEIKGSSLLPAQRFSHGGMCLTVSDFLMKRFSHTGKTSISRSAPSEPDCRCSWYRGPGCGIRSAVWQG